MSCLRVGSGKTSLWGRILKMAKKSTSSYESAVLEVLHGEFSFSKKADIDAAIERRLERGKLGAYDQGRVDVLRRFKDEVQRELGVRPLPEPSRPSESRYYVGRHGHYGDYTDFDIPRLTTDLQSRYPQIPKAVVAWFVHYAVGTYYLL